jgi:uncharacterized protein (TIGR03000 family)
MPPAYRTPAEKVPAPKKIPVPKKTQAEPDRATIVVNLPADAKLTVGGKTTSSTSAQRRFITPPLESQGDSYYVFRAEIVRDGQAMAAERQVVVRPGQETRVTFDFAPMGVALGP